MKHASIYDMFREVCDSNPDKIAYRYKKEGTWHDVTWREQHEACSRVSRALIALGLNKGDRVCVLSNTRLEWVQAEFGANAPGFVIVGIYPSNLPDDCAFIIEHCEARAIIVENQDQMDKLWSVRDRTISVDNYILLDGPSDPDRNILCWGDFLARAEEVEPGRLERMAAAVSGDDLAALAYTSGTTGLPKGVMLSHTNLLAGSESAANALPLEPHFENLLFLPLAHIFAKLIVFFCAREALTISFAESINTLGENLPVAFGRRISIAPGQTWSRLVQGPYDPRYNPQTFARPVGEPLSGRNVKVYLTMELPEIGKRAYVFTFEMRPN